jgi:type III restriction enzyme
MLTQEGAQAIAQDALPELPERFAPYRESLIKLLRAIYTGETLQPEDDRKTINISPNKNFDKAEFQALWRKISLKTVYEVQFDTAKLIADSIQRIDDQLFIGNLMYEIKTGELEKGSHAEMKMQNMVRETSSEQAAVKNMAETQTVYDVIGELETHTQLLRRTLVTILQGISPVKFALLRKNPEAFIAKCARFINEVKASLILNNIVYHKIDAQYDAKTVFTNDKTVLRNADLLKKHIYDHLQTDSGVEKKLLQDLENAPEVIVYAKLPRSFYISTPIAKYSPDWAIVINKEKERHVYFVAESKGSDSDMDLREIEKLKLHCADKHFAAISDGEVHFKRIKSYGNLLEILQ